MATDALAVRMARLEGSYEQLDKRLGDLAGDVHALRAEFRGEMQALRAEFRSEIQGVRSEIESVRAEMRGLRGEMSRLFYWLMGTFLTTLVAIGGVIVTVLVRTR
jgi:predicted nuclease with TOPRIM domain